MPISFTSLKRCLLAILPALVVTLAGFDAKAQQTDYPEDYVSPAVSEEFYKSIRFSWTDSQGQTHISDLTERATDPAHIVALLKEIYTNPAVPGFTYDAGADFIHNPESPEFLNDDCGISATVPYLPCTLAPFSMSPTEEIPVPVSGATALIVEMNDEFTNGINGHYSTPAEGAQLALDAIKSVELISKQMYISEIYDNSSNPGFLFNIEATLNKFFIITKGCNRPIGAGYPLFYNMYEEFSPTNSGPMFNAFASMDAGEQFPVDHNCSTVIGQNHVVVMSNQNANRDYAVNLMFYLPDYRFRGETHSADGIHHYEHYSYYASDYQPYFFFNKIRAKIDGEVSTTISAADQNGVVGHTAWVPVSWVSTYKDITRSNVPEQFYVYRVVNDTFDANPIPAEEIFINKQPETRLLADGSVVRSEDNTVRVFIKEHQSPESRSVRYVIVGRRFGSDFSFVESNEVTAIIPGYANAESLNIVIDGTPRSFYDVDYEKNVYSNNIALTDAASANGDRLLAAHISVATDSAPGTIFELRRYAQGQPGYEVVAEMEVVNSYDKIWDSGNQGVRVYDAVIRYAIGGLDVSASFKSSLVMANHEEDPFQPIVALDANHGVLASFVDNFEASTARGDHPQGYTYQMAIRQEEGSDADPVVSNTVSTTIPVRALYVGYVPYSLDEILADVDADNRLEVNPIGVAFQTKKNTSISGYTVTNVTKGKVVAHAIRTPSGIFERVVYNNNGVANDRLNPTTQPGFFGKLPFRLTSDVDIDDEFALTLEYSNGNTYGNVRSRLTPVPAPEIIDNPLNYVAFYGGEYVYNGGLTWTSEDLAVAPWPAFNDQQPEYTVFDYNVWGRADSDAFDLLYSPGGVVPMNLVEDEDTSVKSVSYDFKAHYATVDNPVEINHIVRLYAAAPSELIIDFDNVTEGFVISETDSQATITQTGPILSGVEDVVTDADESQALYFDLMGRPVDRQALTPGIYLRVVGDHSEKISIR